MIHRIRVDLFFPDKADSDEIWAKVKGYLRDKNITSLNKEKSFIDYQECHHDESPPQSCKVIERFEK